MKTLPIWSSEYYRLKFGKKKRKERSDIHLQLKCHTLMPPERMDYERDKCTRLTDRKKKRELTEKNVLYGSNRLYVRKELEVEWRVMNSYMHNARFRRRTPHNFVDVAGLCRTRYEGKLCSVIVSICR